MFRGRKANLIKIVYWDGTGLCLFTKRLEQGVFLWPPDVDPGETLALSSEQLSMLIDGVDWRAPERESPPSHVAIIMVSQSVAAKQVVVIAQPVTAGRHRR